MKLFLFIVSVGLPLIFATILHIGFEHYEEQNRLKFASLEAQIEKMGEKISFLEWQVVEAHMRIERMK